MNTGLALVFMDGRIKSDHDGGGEATFVCRRA